MAAHHESYAGSGYPGGLKGDEIPLGSRIVSVIDAYDAMISNRCYRKGLAHEEAVRRLLADAGTQFDPLVAGKLDGSQGAASGSGEDISHFVVRNVDEGLDLRSGRSFGKVCICGEPGGHHPYLTASIPRRVP